MSTVSCFSFNFTLWYLNDTDYYGEFEQEGIQQLFEAMRLNYKAWCKRFAPLPIGGDMKTTTIQEFSKILFNMRLDIALSVAEWYAIFVTPYYYVLLYNSKYERLSYLGSSFLVPPPLAASLYLRWCRLTVTDSNWGRQMMWFQWFLGTFAMTLLLDYIYLVTLIDLFTWRSTLNCNI